MNNELLKKVEAIIDKDAPLISNLANISSILNEMDNINWCGFYLVKGTDLYLGPFQGEVACIKIPFGKGVCGSAAVRKESIIVDNVLEFKGHIACSSKSRSEIVTPVIKEDRVVAIIDIDAPIFNRFNNDDKELLEAVANKLEDLF